MQAKLKEIFSLDYRSLALMRIGMGIVILIDLIERARSLTAHYTDAGVLPRSHFLELFNNPWLISIHNMSGTLFFETVLFVLGGIIAISLIIGYRTTLATILAWFFVISLQNRNPLVIQGGDVIFRVVLFWTMFLPWGKRWSLDNALNRQKPAQEKTTVSAATVAYIIQLVLFYGMSGFLKTGSQWANGTAIYYALSIDQFTTMFGHFILGFQKLMTLLTKGTIYLERFGPLLFIFPLFNPWTRMLAVLLFALLQIGINLSMSIGLFGAISIVITLGLLPSEFWDKVLPYFSLSKKTGLTIYYDADCGFCTRMTHYIRRFLFLSSETKLIPAEENPDILAKMTREDSWIVVDEKGIEHTHFDGVITAVRFSPIYWPLTFFMKLPGIYHIGDYYYRRIAEKRLKICLPPKVEKFTPRQMRNKKYKKIAGQTIVGALALYVVLWNVSGLPNQATIMPKVLKPLAWMTRLDQKFDMFAPYPLTEDGWYVIPGTLKDGTLIDVYKNGAPVSYGKPTLVSRTYMDQRWQKYMMNLWRNDYSKYRLYYGQYLCRQWNTSHPDENKKLDTFKIIYMREDTLPNYKTAAIQPTTIWEHNCFK